MISIDLKIEVNRSENDINSGEKEIDRSENNINLGEKEINRSENDFNSGENEINPPENKIFSNEKELDQVSVDFERLENYFEVEHNDINRVGNNNINLKINGFEVTPF